MGITGEMILPGIAGNHYDAAPCVRTTISDVVRDAPKKPFIEVAHEWSDYLQKLGPAKWADIEKTARKIVYDPVACRILGIDYTKVTTEDEIRAELFACVTKYGVTAQNQKYQI